MSRTIAAAAIVALAIVGGSAAVLAPSASHAELAQGRQAPLFATMGAIGGKSYRVTLAKQLKRGPVVLYFFPKAFTAGCTLEAHAFAEATADFKRAGATVIGLSTDDLPTLKKFSKEECRDKFAVATATPAIVRAYDVDLQKDGKSTGLTQRTSYVIDRTGRIVFVHNDLDYKDHVRLTLAAVQRLKTTR